MLHSFTMYFRFEVPTNFDADINMQMDSKNENADNGHDAPRPNDGKLYLRYDEAGIMPIPGTARSHNLPHAIVRERKIPRNLVSDMQYVIKQKKQEFYWSNVIVFIYHFTLLFILL